MELTDYRDRFPILADTVYLIDHSSGAMPAAEERPAEYARTGKTRGIPGWAEGLVGDAARRHHRVHLHEVR